MMDSSALRDARDPSRAVTMTTRIIAPVGAFALGAYAENRGYVDAALRKAREMDPTIRTGVDALFAAICEGDDVERVEEALRNGAAVDCKKDGDTMLVHAVLRGRNRIAKLLLARGADVIPIRLEIRRAVREGAYDKVGQIVFAGSVADVVQDVLPTVTDMSFLL